MFLTAHLLLLAALLAQAPQGLLDPGAREFILIIGAVGIWRYGWGLVHLARALVYRWLVWPGYRARAEAVASSGNEGEASPPVPELYVCVTSYRMEVETTRLVYRRLIEEAAGLNVPVLIVAAVVEMADQRFIKRAFELAAPPERVRLALVRVRPTGKRDALAGALIAASRAAPAPGSAVVLMDGDSLLPEGGLARSLRFFDAMPSIGALTTDEEAVVTSEGRALRSWFRLRFAQRHLLMCSMGLSKTLLTLTGRFSIFRAEIATDPSFIEAVRADSLEHWRLGRVPMLTGEDKSTWYWLLERGWPMLYVPDVKVVTIDHPPFPDFWRTSTALMARFYGNMIRASGRAIALGPGRIGLFPWWCLIDQRLSMWTPLIGPTAALLGTLAFGAQVLHVYALWVMLTRLIQAALLQLFRPGIDGLWPALLYFNQVAGALIKTFVLFRPQRQAWTRQRVRLFLDRPAGVRRAHAAASTLIHALALACLVTAVAIATGVLPLSFPPPL